MADPIAVPASMSYLSEPEAALSSLLEAHHFSEYLDPDTVRVVENVICADIPPRSITLSMGANAHYFGHPEWGQGYFDHCHRDSAFIDRWRHATGSWDGKVVVDVGCGAGNIFASLGGTPSTLIGVDISFSALKMSSTLGYLPLFADAQCMPLYSAIADIVVLNASLHHCDDMEAVLRESARLVKPGGVLVTDHDLQRTAWHFKGLARYLWSLRLPYYRLTKRGGHASELEQRCALSTEAHHVVGDGLYPEFYSTVLEPLGFSVAVYPHNHSLGAEIFDGRLGRSSTKYRLAQRISGLDPNSAEAALSLMCIAHKTC